MAHGTYADYLRAEGQQEKAAVADAEASEILLDELMKLDEQHTQTVIAKRIFTNMNMQSRYGGGGGALGANGGSASTTINGYTNLAGDFYTNLAGDFYTQPAA